MKDNISVQRIQELNPVAREIFTQFVTECENAHGNTLRIMEPVFRSIAAQNELYAHGHNGDTRPIVTNARGGYSYHNYGLAIDICELTADGNEINWNYDLGVLTPIADKYGIEWGGNFHTIKDRPHFQKTFGYTVEQLLALFTSGKIENGYVVINVSNDENA